MSLKFVDLGVAAEMMGHDWTIKKIISKILEGVLTAYARIHCCPQNDSILHDSDEDEDEKYEIVRITNIKETSFSSDSTKWYSIDYEPIDRLIGSEEKDHCEAHLASDNYCDGRVFDYLKSKSSRKDLVSTEQI